MKMIDPEPIRVLVVDDEQPARELLCELIRDDNRFQVVGNSICGKDAIVDFQRLKPDVLFLDIQMPEANGFHVCQNIDLGNTALVFVTASTEFALQAFEVQAMDYVVKPIRLDRFQRTLSRVIDFVQGYRSSTQAAQTVQMNEKIVKEKSVLQTVRGAVFFLRADFQYLEGSGNYVRVWIAGDCHLIRCTMKEIVSQFDTTEILQVHRSFAVSTSQIRQLIRNRDGTVELLLTGASIRIPVSRSRRDVVESLLLNGTNEGF